MLGVFIAMYMSGCDSNQHHINEETQTSTEPDTVVNTKSSEISEAEPIFYEKITDPENQEMETIEFELLDESFYTSDHLNKYWNLNAKEITFWDNLNRDEYLDTLIEKGHITFSGTCNFDEEQLIVSYGRKIAEMQVYRDPHYGENDYVLVVTFEGERHDETAFFYKIGKRIIVPPDLSSPCYLLQDEKVYIGNTVYALNEREGAQEGM